MPWFPVWPCPHYPSIHLWRPIIRQKNTIIRKKVYVRIKLWKVLRCSTVYVYAIFGSEVRYIVTLKLQQSLFHVLTFIKDYQLYCNITSEHHGAKWLDSSAFKKIRLTFVVFRLWYLRQYTIHLKLSSRYESLTSSRIHPHVYYTYISEVYKDPKTCCQIVEQKNTSHWNVHNMFRYVKFATRKFEVNHENAMWKYVEDSP